jgi:transposase
MRAACRKPPVPASWLARMLVKKPRMLVAVALANKMARKIWAMLTKEEDHREQALTGGHDPVTNRIR